MFRNKALILACAALCSVALTLALGQTNASAGDAENSDQNKLVVLWTSGDPDVAKNMAFMYTHYGKKAGWWDEIALVVWGPSAKLLTEDSELQELVRNMQSVGVRTQACIVCADRYGVTAKLRELGIEVIPMGKPLTDMLQSGWTLLSV
jgi:hypothetical protein